MTPWIKFYPSDYRTGVIGTLSLEEEGLLWRCCAIIYDTGKAIPFEECQAARLLGVHISQYRKLLKILVTKGKLVKHEDGWHNLRALRELKQRQIRQQHIIDGNEVNSTVNHRLNSSINCQILARPLDDLSVNSEPNPLVERDVNCSVAGSLSTNHIVNEKDKLPINGNVSVSEFRDKPDFNSTIVPEVNSAVNPCVGLKFSSELSNEINALNGKSYEQPSHVRAHSRNQIPEKVKDIDLSYDKSSGKACGDTNQKINTSGDDQTEVPPGDPVGDLLVALSKNSPQATLSKTPADDPEERALFAYLELAKRVNLPIPRSALSQLRAQLRSRIKDAGGLDGFLQVLELIEKSAFLCGETTDFRVSLPWLLKANNFRKVRDGQYGNGRHRKPYDKVTIERLVQQKRELALLAGEI